MLRLLPLLALLLSACTVAPVPGAPPTPRTAPAPAPSPAQGAIRRRAERAARQFVQVVETVEPVAEAECRARAPRANCDFRIVVDERPNQAPNAFQTLDRAGRPIVAFNLGLIASVDNADELAFVMGHESAHHVLGHIVRQRRNATAGAAIFGSLAGLTGGNESVIRNAQELGASLGARTYSKEFELEADALGTIIAARAGYDPVRGARFFTRIPDPGNRFLGTHPPNGARMAVVRRTVAGL